MKFERTPRFDNDYKRLRNEHKEKFRSRIPPFHEACEGYLADPGGFVWPAALRVSRMAGVKEVWQVTRSFASPDGRATFEFVTVDGEPRVRWRRIGDHRVYKEP
ncbi:MAG: hypothetical protein ACR2K2_15315 [Mycobacteriales bacterium]